MVKTKKEHKANMKMLKLEALLFAGVMALGAVHAGEERWEVRATEHPDNNGGLKIQLRKDGGEWQDPIYRDFCFAKSNLGPWGNKNLYDPVLYRDADQTWHVYYKDGRGADAKDCHTASWGVHNLRDWGRQRFVTEDADRARLAKARAGTGIWPITAEEAENIKRSEWHDICPWHFVLDEAKDDVARYGKVAAGTKARLTVGDVKKAYPISTNLIGLFFEDLNSAHEVYSSNHKGTYKGHGFRKDVGEALAAIKPKFVRFPGGCLVHGWSFKGMYRWKETVGPLSERKPKPNDQWGGMQDYALGYYEYFQLCEDIGADALPVLPVGVTCPNPQIMVTDEELDELVADAVDLIDFAKGDPSKSKWAKIRADMGHPKPFGLKYIGLGNEEDITDWFERGFTRVYEAVRAKDPTVKVVGTAGASPTGRDYAEGWKLAKDLKVDIVDEHYYVGPGWFYGNQHFYDDYDRKGPKVYAGEYAAHKSNRVNDMETACSIAVHLTNLERNGDIVEMASYAPLFAKKDNIRWKTDLIYFDDASIELTTDYWVQWLFGNFAGRTYVPNTLEVTVPAGLDNKDDEQRLRNRFAASVVKSGKRTYIKVVNSTGFAIPLEIDLASLGIRKGATIRTTMLQSDDFNKRDVKPQKGRFVYDPVKPVTLPPYSVSVWEM